MSFTKFGNVLFGMLLAAMILFISVDARAGGTAPSTTISNRARVSWIVSGSNQDSVSATLDSSPAKISSDTLTAPANQSAAVGESKTFTYEFYNTGNRADTFLISVDSFSMGGGANSWAFALYVGGSITSVEDDTKTSASIAADGVGSCSVVVWANSNPVNSIDGSFADFRLVIVPGNLANADTTKQYTGDNNITYAHGDAASNDVARATVAAPVLTITKTIPSVTIGGLASLPFPGATILYNLAYNNSGSDTADSVVIRDTITTATTTFDTMSRQGATLAGSATFVTDTGATGWLAQVTTVANPDHTFYSVDWVNAHDWTGAGTIQHVRWIRQKVAAGQSASMQFRVIIK